MELSPEEKLKALYWQLDRATYRSAKAQRELNTWEEEIVALVNRILPLREQLLATPTNA
jgi:hypothetical protein